ncbi:MAG: hypothetical protein KAV00_16520 [Phycisphaerae bacterium]|nr:hypothetical protein [Phycisphaerae bacterium]
MADCRHDMVVELLPAFRRFNPDKANREIFINRVLDRSVKYTTRIRWRTRNATECIVDITVAGSNNSTRVGTSGFCQDSAECVRDEVIDGI